MFKANAPANRRRVSDVRFRQWFGASSVSQVSSFLQGLFIIVSAIEGPNSVIAPLAFGSYPVANDCRKSESEDSQECPRNFFGSCSSRPFVFKVRLQEQDESCNDGLPFLRNSVLAREFVLIEVVIQGPSPTVVDFIHPGINASCEEAVFELVIRDEPSNEVAEVLRQIVSCLSINHVSFTEHQP